MSGSYPAPGKVTVKVRYEKKQQYQERATILGLYFPVFPAHVAYHLHIHPHLIFFFYQLL